MAEDRDRDEIGRARQARPRDELGRPLPYGAQGVTPFPDEALPPLDTVTAARQLVRDGRPFAAHEVLEARWKTAPPVERELWQGLAQACVAMTHAARGNHVGAARVLERATGLLERYASTAGPTYGVDLAATVTCAQDKVAAARP